MICGLGAAYPSGLENSETVDICPDNIIRYSDPVAGAKEEDCGGRAFCLSRSVYSDFRSSSPFISSFSPSPRIHFSPFPKRVRSCTRVQCNAALINDPRKGYINAQICPFSVLNKVKRTLKMAVGADAEICLHLEWKEGHPKA